MITLEIDNMSRVEKLQTMETLWTDLSQDDSGIESPPWHQDALKETEQRASLGLEQPIDWKNAKQELRKRFE
jgi:hypothetical protein